jgi:putrescine transport system permease protein
VTRALLSRIRPRPRHWVIAGPYIWLLIFFVLPFAFVGKISLSQAELSIPPYAPMFQWVGDALKLQLHLDNYRLLLDDPLYLQAYGNSLKLAFWSTVLCLLLGYPMAYAVARASAGMQAVWLLLILLPSWTSFLIRVYAWMGLLSNSGLINNVMLWAGLIDQPLQMLNTNFAVYVGVVYSYLPFMVLPLYANLVKHDRALLEAASDLGASTPSAFFRITVPLSRNGIIAGALLVFIPVVGEYVIPELLGGTQTIVIGKVLWDEFFQNRDWPVASALAVVMILILIVPIAMFNRYLNKEVEQ